MRTLRHLSLAFGFMSRIPMPAVRDYQDSDLSRAAPWFPFVGAVVGAGVAGALWALADRPLLAGLAGLLLWVVVTGALHLDGLGDVADAFGAAHRSPERFLEVLKDPHLGVFGVVAIVVQLLAKLVLLAELARGGVTLDLAVGLVLVPAWARWATLLCSKVLPPLPGTPTAFHSTPRGWTSVVAWALVLLAAGAATAPATLVALPLSVLAIGYWRTRLGGASGDCFGATIEVLESVLLVALVVAVAVTA